MSSASIFAGIEWEPVGPGARQRVVTRAGRRVRLLELTPAFSEREWCERGHIGYVVAGELEVAFETGVRRFSAGEAFAIDGGAVSRHKATALTAPTTVFLVDEG